MHVLLFLLLLAVVGAERVRAQELQPQLSRVQWLNATSVAPLEFVLNGTRLSSSWAPGQRSGAGVFPALQWKAQFTPATPLEPVRFELNLQDGDSAAAVLIGNFEEVEEGQLNPARLPPGYTVNDERKVVRAGLVRVRVGKARGASYPVYLLNGIPDEKLRVEVVGEGVFELEYGVMQSFQAAPGTRPELRLPGRALTVGFEVDDISRGGLFGFYRSPGKEQVEYGFLRLQSIESSKEREAELARRERDEEAAAEPE
jgi:hypothetical protein